MGGKVRQGRVQVITVRASFVRYLARGLDEEDGSRENRVG